MSDFLSAVARRALGEPPEIRPVVPAVIPPSLSAAAGGRPARSGGVDLRPFGSADEQVSYAAGAGATGATGATGGRSLVPASPAQPPAGSVTPAAVRPRQAAVRPAPSRRDPEPASPEGEEERPEAVAREPLVASRRASERRETGRATATPETASGDPASGPERSPVSALRDQIVPGERPTHAPLPDEPPSGSPPRQVSPARPLPVEAWKTAPAPASREAWEEDDRDERPTVRVSIGRIEVRAPAPAAAPPPPPRPVGPRVTLDDYLTRRDAPGPR